MKRNEGWFYAAIRITKRVGNKTVHWYQIHEIFPHGRKLLWTKEPITPTGDSLNDLRWALSMMCADTLRIPVYEIRNNRLVKRALGLNEKENS